MISAGRFSSENKTEVTKEIPMTQEYFECIYKKTSNNLAATLALREKKSNHKSPIKDFVLVQNKMGPILSNFYWIEHHFS